MKVADVKKTLSTEVEMLQENLEGVLESRGQTCLKTVIHKMTDPWHHTHHIMLPLQGDP